MDITLRHGIEYEVMNAVSVEDLIKSLEANARLLRRSAELLSALIPGLTLEPKYVSVTSLTQESPLREVFALAAVLAYQKELEAEVPQLIESLTGVHVSDRYDALVTTLVMLIAIYGISKAFEMLFPGRDKQPLVDTEDALLEQASRFLGVATHRIRDAVTVLFTGKQRRALVSASQKVFAPTRSQVGANIRTRDGITLVSREAVTLAQSAAGMPFEPDEEEDAPRTESEFHHGAKIILHAMDRDRKKAGWAGHIPSLFDDRIPMHLEKSQNPEAIFGKSEIIGDILLTKEEDENGDMKPKEFLLVRT